MANPEQEAPQERKKRTIWLLAAGTVSLLIPLGGAVYLHWSQNAGGSGPSGRNDVFERRDGDDHKITPTQSAVVTSPSALTTPPPSGMIAGVGAKPAGSSLDFIQSNADMQARINDSRAAVAALPAASTAPAAPPPAAPVAAAAPKKTKPGKKAFTMPKLQPSRGFTSMGSTGAQGAASGSQSGAGGGAQTGGAGAAGTLDMSDPRVQAYLKAHQGQ